MNRVDSTELAKQHSPLYRTIEQDLRSRIQSGRWSVGTMLPSRKSLAKEYGVDMRTIQRAIGDLLADGTLHAHGGRGTFVAASSSVVTDIVRPTVRTVAIIAEQSFNPVPSWPAVIHSIHEGLRKNTEDCRIITINTSDNDPTNVIRHERDALRLVESERLVGVVMFHAGGEATIPDIQRVLALGIPVVFIDRVPSGLVCDFVGIDNRLAAREAVEYLLGIGHQRIAFVTPDEDVSSINDRFQGYLDALLNAGIRPSEAPVFRLSLAKSFAREGLRSEMDRVVQEMLAMPDPPTAVFAVNDFVAEYLLITLSNRGISVPESLSVVGFDDVEYFLPQKPRLTTIRQPFEAIGERAANLLSARLANKLTGTPTAYQHILLPTRLIVRETTRPLTQTG